MDENLYQAAHAPSTAVVPPALGWSHAQPYGPYQEYVGFWRRLLARCIDGFLVGLVSIPLSALLDAMLARVPAEDVSADGVWFALFVWLAATFVLLIVTDWLYYAALESSAWQATLGKRALGIVVSDLSGGRISFGRATGRYFAHYVSDITLGIGYLIQPFTGKRQALHDLIAGTLVVRN